MPLQKRRALFADLFHMHVNRVFAQGQRLHEAALYYFIWKEQLRERSLAKPLALLAP
ncbi:lantibiotic dehydratase C-terminal domain-containing protein [Mucilaginibacter sp. UC70_90]